MGVSDVAPSYDDIIAERDKCKAQCAGLTRQLTRCLAERDERSEVLRAFIRFADEDQPDGNAVSRLMATQLRIGRLADLAYSTLGGGR